MMQSDNISFSLLVSIPKKVNAWLAFLNTDLSEKGYFKSLSWDFSDTHKQFLSLDADADGEYVGFEMTTDEERTYDDEGVDITPYNPWMVNCTEEWVLHDIPNNIDRFVALEKRIYNVMEDLAQHLKKVAEEKRAQERE